MTIEERIRYQIGEEGPQHESKEDYEAYIDDQLEGMNTVEFLHRVSSEIEELLAGYEPRKPLIDPRCIF